MNWKSIPKQQRDLIVLGIMGVVTTFFILANLVLTPAKTKAAAARKTTEELDPKVRKAEGQVRWDTRNKKDIQDIAAKLLAAQKDDLPTEGSRYLWAHKQLSDIGHSQGLALRIREITESRTPSDRSAEGAQPSLEWLPYAVEVSMNASFEELKNFLAEVSRSNAYASLGSLELMPQAESSEKHSVRMSIQWPIAVNPRAQASLRSFVEASR